MSAFFQLAVLLAATAICAGESKEPPDLSIHFVTLPAVNADANYNGLNVPDVAVTNTDADGNTNVKTEHPGFWLTVHNYPEGDGPENVVSNGIPFKPGSLFDERDIKVLDGGTEVPIATKVLAYWLYDNSIRAVLVQFNADFPGETKNYTLEIGGRRTTPDVPLTPVTWDLPKKIITLQAAYLCDSLVVWEQKPLGQTGFPEWEQKQLNYYYRIRGVGTASCANADQYYNTIHSTYQIYARTGELEYLVNGRKWALHHRRDQIYLEGDRIGHGKCSLWQGTRYTYIQGLVDDYFFWGDEESKRVSGLVADHFYMKHEDKWYYKAPGERGSWTERQPAFALLGLITHFEAANGPAYLDTVKERVDLLYKMQIDNGGTAWIHNLYDHDPAEGCSVDDWGSSPWMSGLLLEGIIKFHKLTRDANALQSIFMALDYLKENCLATTGKHAGKSFVYLGCPRYTSGTPDLDNMISHAYAYGYRISGYTREDYLTLAKDLFNTSVSYGGVPGPKHFNQQFRTSGHTVSYIAPDERPAQKELHLHPGWNLISICLDIADTNLLSVLAPIEGLYRSVWAYDATSGSWKRYVPGGTAFLNNLDTIEPGRGYWIDMIDGAVLTITGVPMTNTAAQLYQGWNLVGYNSITTQPRESALFSIAGKYISIWTYDSITGTWLRYVVGVPAFLNDLNQLESEKGYWIYVEEDCEWSVSP